jgi:hypothetical protein
VASLAVACGLDVTGALLPGGPDAGGTPDGSLPRPDGTPPPQGDAGGQGDAPSAADVSASDDAPPPPPGDAPGQVDSPPPPPFDASACLFCNGACVSTCMGCSAGQALCEATRTCGDCTGCADGTGTARPIQCFECPTPSRQGAIGTCQPNDSNAYCLQGNTDPGFGHCECADAACPGSTEVCMDINVGINVCVTCGENTQILGRSTDNGSCQGGGKCHANGSGGGPPYCQ